MEDMIEIRKYQNITDRLARLMKSPKNPQNLEKSEKLATQPRKTVFQNSRNLRKNQTKNQFQFSDISNLIRDVTQTQSLKKIKSQDKLKRILNKNVKRQNTIQQEQNLRQNNQLSDQKMFFKDPQYKHHENQITKIIDCLQFNQQANLTKREIENKFFISNKLQNQTKRPKFQFEKTVLIKNTQNSVDTQEKKQRVFGNKVRHLHHKSTADFNHLGKVRAQNKNKIPIFQHLTTEESVDQINVVQPAIRYNTFQQDNYQNSKQSFKLQRNRSDFNRAPGRIFKNK